jgi:hypothetical protein
MSAFLPPRWRNLIQQAVRRYAALMIDGVAFSPVVLVEQAPGSSLLADGHHRYEAAWLLTLYTNGPRH